MKTIKSTIAIVLALSAAGSFAQEFYDNARVISSNAIVERVNVPRKECWTESREERVPDNGNGTAGTIIGGVLGGVIGHQIGGGHGRDVATVGGAIAGAMIGNHVATQGTQGPQYAEREERRCRQVDAWQDQVTGYQVNYEYRGHTLTTTMPQQPGSTIPVRVDVSPR
ncbi:glycine zipper 2TM domain-containing protein [Andreprevotia chitinilytica]|uniref:glycine zipper 2TM domain-containing protein n=1 Tax=Andreprevotia chitinilytica TaxID=396808 RepID=UPI00055971F7|nr:glycine zipper 2TM domain-containing protein [Andreprevotia chitinilytica]